ncbi:hypothetical protein [Shigella flexneri]|uniref:hypothetical protein n=1 Tax=Shigella flexneri TaxID=623 RepID=UPI00067F1334|nr:hypothetical protein [Shigella flexneri]
MRWLLKKRTNGSVRYCQYTSGYAKAHPELISAFMTTTAANFATLTEREIAEAEQVTTINVKTGEVES